MKHTATFSTSSAGCTGPCTDCALAQMGREFTPRPSLRVVRTALRVFVLPLSGCLVGGLCVSSHPVWQPFGVAVGFWLGARVSALGKGGRWI